MSEVKRYFLETTGEGAGTLIEAQGGDYVLHTDYESLRTRAERLAEALRVCISWGCGSSEGLEVAKAALSSTPRNDAGGGEVCPECKGTKTVRFPNSPTLYPCEACMPLQERREVHAKEIGEGG